MREPRPNAPGFLVVLEGIDGSGKSSLQGFLARVLSDEGLEVVTTKEPTDGPIGQRIREIAAKGRDQVTAEEELRLFHEDRLIHVRELVRPALARGAVVIQDRSYFSTVAYQGERGLDREMLIRSEEAIAPEPDLLLVVDVPVQIALERIRRSRAISDDFELADSLERVREVFQAFPRKTLIDGSRAFDEVCHQALTVVRASLPPEMSKLG